MNVGRAWYWENYKRVFDARLQMYCSNLAFHDMASGRFPDPRLGPCSLLDYSAAMEREINELFQSPS